MKGVSIIFNLYQPDKKVLEEILKSFEKQKVDFQVELIIVDKKTDDVEKEMINKFAKKYKNIKTNIIKVNENLSFAGSMNAGLRKSYYDILVIIQQDCIPIGFTWLSNLVEPLKNKGVVATASKVTYPDKLWNSLSFFAKSIMLHEKGTITPELDEKACGYKKEAIESVGLFNETDFRTAGEDYDMYVKLKEIGKIGYPNAEVYHYHPANLSSRIKKTRQWANGFGTLFNKYGTRMPGWYKGFLKATPIIGIFFFLISFPFSKGLRFFPAYILLTPTLHIYYGLGFWSGFLRGRQEVDVFVKRK